MRRERTRGVDTIVVGDRLVNTRLHPPENTTIIIHVAEINERDNWCRLEWVRDGIKRGYTYTLANTLQALEEDIYSLCERDYL